MESAKDGRMINTHVNNNLKRIGFGPALSSTPGPKFPVRIIIKPTTPKHNEAMIKTFVAIFCIYILYINLSKLFHHEFLHVN